MNVHYQNKDTHTNNPILWMTNILVCQLFSKIFSSYPDTEAIADIEC